MVNRFIAACAAVIALSGAAHADILLGEKNSASVSVGPGSPLALDGKHTTLSFTTTRPAETVELSMSTVCNLTMNAQAAAATSPATITVAMAFVLDGVELADGSLPELLCAATVPASTASSAFANAVEVRRVTSIAKPGTHTIGILVGLFDPSNANAQILQTHTVISN